jgi:hypothetical protein
VLAVMIDCDDDPIVSIAHAGALTAKIVPMRHTRTGSTATRSETGSFS